MRFWLTVEHDTRCLVIAMLPLLLHLFILVTDAIVLREVSNLSEHHAPDPTLITVQFFRHVVGEAIINAIRFLRRRPYHAR